LNVVTRYFTFEIDGRRTGVIRRRETSNRLRFERMERGSWVEDPNLARHFSGIGGDEGDEPVEITETEALELADGGSRS
jgi:hypothetical protein